MRADYGITSKSFTGSSGGAEHFISIAPPAGLDLAGQLQYAEALYEDARAALDLAPESAIFRRIFVSDVINQAAMLRDSPLFAEPADSPVAVSIVQQPPLPDSKIALLAYHIEGGARITKRRLSPKHFAVQKAGLTHLWSTRLCAGAYGSSASAAAQTGAVFGDLIATLAAQGGTLRDNCVRTWIYLKDVDVFYQGMVDSRSDLFLREGLTRDTHFIASTGIEGACAHRYDLVAMDAYSILGLAPEQTTYLNDFGQLCGTADYNVTFERGTRIAYADRSHHFISGTASIDSAGRVVHPGDVLRQLDRALTNVDALLRSGSASLNDMMHFTVYLRDPTDQGRVRSYLAELFPDLPVVIVHAAVCRPEWLIEIEGVAIARENAPALPAF
jgi:enamine deaminase RidA (YjgF/YER057c/UK114 family)